MIIINKKTKEKWSVMNFSRIYAWLLGGTYTLCNTKTKKTKEITGYRFKKEYEVFKE